MENNPVYVTLAVVSHYDRSGCRFLVEFPEFEVDTGNVVLFKDFDRFHFGIAERTVHCEAGSECYNAFRAIYGEDPLPGIASYAVRYEAEPEAPEFPNLRKELLESGKMP